MRRDVPPRAATWLMSLVARGRDREAVVGDLVEEYAMRARLGTPTAASRWYWGQVCRSAPQVLWRSANRDRWFLTVAVAMAAYFVAAGVESAGVVALSQVLVADGRAHAIASLALGLATMVIGGYCAAWIRPAAATVMAAITSIAVSRLMITTDSGAPLWYWLVFLIVCPLATLTGKALRGDRPAVLGKGTA